MTSKSKNTSTSEPTPAVTIPRGTPRFSWSVKGRGKSATYCAGLPAGSGRKGQRVALVAKSGAVTFATLTEVRETADGVSRWDFDRDQERMTPEVKRANRAAKSAASAAYWQSDAGLKTAERIDARMNAKSEQSESEDAGSEPEPEPEQSEPADVDAIVAAAVAAALAAHGIGQSEPEPAPASKPRASKPRASKSTSKPRATRGTSKSDPRKPR